MRTSFWERATTFAGFDKETLSIDELFNKRKYYFDNLHQKLTIQQYIDTYFYSEWAYKNAITFPSIYDLMESFAINNISFRIKCGEKITLDMFFIYVELVYNIVSIKRVSRCDIIKFILQIQNNIRLDCERLGFEIREFGDEKYIIVEKSAAATAVADKYADKDLEFSFKVIEYNHFLLKGKIDRKWEILSALALKFESIRQQLETGRFREIAKDVGFLLNNLNIRHNNTCPGTKNYKGFIEQMSSEDLEGWYDKTYNILLLALLADDFSALHEEVQELKRTQATTEDEHPLNSR